MIGALFLSMAVICAPHPISFLLAVFVHELSHVITARIFGWGKAYRVFPLTGFRMCYSGVHTTVSRACVSLSGCALGFLIYFIPLFQYSFRMYSLGLSLFNLLPIRGLDGGEAFIALAEAFLGIRAAWMAFRVVSVACALFLWGTCTAVQLKAGPNVTLLAVTMFLTVKALETEKSF